MEIEIIDMEPLTLLGIDYYGPIETLRDEMTPIETLWERFSLFCKNRWYTIEDLILDESISYEVHIWNQEELEDTKNFMAFIGVEVEELIETPVELVGKILPCGKYAKATLIGKEIEEWEKLVYKEWLENSDYQVRMFGTYSLDYQRYDDKYFKGIENLENSKLEVYIPIEDFEENTGT